MVAQEHCKTDVPLKSTTQQLPLPAIPTTHEHRMRNQIQHRIMYRIIRRIITMALHNIRNIPSQAPHPIGHTTLLRSPITASTFSHRVTCPKHIGNLVPLPSLLRQEQSESTTSHNPNPPHPHSHKYRTFPNHLQTISSPLPSHRFVSTLQTKNSSSSI